MLASGGRPLVVVLVAVALTWSAAPLLADLLARSAARAAARTGDPPLAPDAGGTVTTLVRPGGEPDDVVRTAVLMAAAAGPVAVVAHRDRRLPDGIEDVATVFRGATVEEAVAEAATRVETTAVLVVSARSVPHADHVRRAAGLLSDDVAWVTGRVQPFTDEGFAPDHRDELTSRLRARARRGGLELWEPDATLVRAELLADHPPPPGRPWGAWLRARRAEGRRGVGVDEVLALRSTPLEPSAFWPDAIARQRGAAADLASATRSGPARDRLLAGLLLARELYGFGVLCWASLPLSMGASGEVPIAAPAGWAAAVAAGLAVLRWASLRAATGAPLHPGRDVLAALHHLPGSLAALWGATTARVPSSRTYAPTRPLVWASLVLTLLAAAPLVDHDPGAPVSRTAVGTSLVTLLLLWAFTVRALVQRSWRRRSHRIALDLPARVDGVPTRLVDGSPSGAAARPGPQGATAGSEVRVEVDLDDGTHVTTTATVAARRLVDGDVVLGLELRLDDAASAAWLGQLLRAGTERAPRRAVRLPDLTGGGTPRARLANLADALSLGLVTVCSTAIVAVLLLVMLGFQPLVVRSPSMVPTLGIGDVVLSEQVPASEVGPGDVVTQPDGLGPEEAMTHRVVAVEPDRDGLRFETRGDANTTSEVWTVAPETLVGRHRWTIPWVGRLASGVRHSGTQLGLAAACLAAVVVALVRRQPAGRTSRPAQVSA